MPRRSGSHRVSSLLLGAWFALFSMAPNSWRPCPMHASADAMAHGAGAGPTVAAHCEHGQETRTGTSARPVGSTSPSPSHPCDCPPSCSCIPSVARVDRALQVHIATVRIVEAATAEPTARRVTSGDRLLPFANGPPAVTAG